MSRTPDQESNVTPGPYERITADDVQVGDIIGRTRAEATDRVDRIDEGPVARRFHLTYVGPTVQGDLNAENPADRRTRTTCENRGNIRPRRTAKLWRLKPANPTGPGDEEVLTLKRSQLIAGVEAAIERAETRTYIPSSGSSNILPDPALNAEAAAALRSSARTVKQIALGSYCIGECGCPMVQAGLADRHGPKQNFTLIGSDIDQAIGGAPHGIYQIVED